jgi:hypothetical protein
MDEDPEFDRGKFQLSARISQTAQSMPVINETGNANTNAEAWDVDFLVVSMLRSVPAKT